VAVTMSNGRTVEIFPPIENTCFHLESLVGHSNETLAILVSQGINTCSLDVALFLSAAFNFGRHQLDAVTLGWIRTATRTQIAFRLFQNNLKTGGGTDKERLATHNRMRNILFRIMSEDYESIKQNGLNDLGEVCGHLWSGLPSLTYTWLFLYICCNGRRVQPTDSIPRARTGHNITLVEQASGPRKDERTGLPPWTALCDTVADRYFPDMQPEQANTNEIGDMVTPFGPCPGQESSCKQLPRKLVRILDRFPKFMEVAVDHGSPMHHEVHRKYLRDMTVKAWVDTHNLEVSATYKPVGVGLFRESKVHFTGRAWDPPGFPQFKGKLCEFDGQAIGAEPVAFGGKHLLDKLEKSCRVTQLVYKLVAMTCSRADRERNQSRLYNQ
jgi:hypothetical protein